ncbi:MAG: T9SS type A sorting domain-containing protein [Bacteroidales bacterium]
MKKNLPPLSGKAFRIFLLLCFSVLFQSLFVNSVEAQIWRPEGLNMPGAWNGWTNPPTNNLALASSTQVPGGRITIDTVGTTRWKTTLSVAATGGDIVGGTYNWLFTSGPSSGAFNNKWAGVTVVVNTLQSYTYQGATDNNVTITNGKWYTINWEDKGYMSSRAIFMETSALPVNILSVSVPVSVSPNTVTPITVTTSLAKSAEEIIYLRYTTDAWVTSIALPVTMSGTSGSVDLPGQASGTTVSYYALSSTVVSLSDNFDLCTINLNNNTGANYSYSIAAPIPTITWANLQYPGSGAIETGETFEVYGQALIPGVTGQDTSAPGLQAWVGYSTSNTNPNIWNNWILCDYNGSDGNNDEFFADLGAVITTAGTYYYATRFQLNVDPYVYGGFNGGFWDGTTNISGTLTITDPIPDPDFDWVNLQHPDTGTIVLQQDYLVYAQAYIQGVTGQITPAPGIQSWIGFSTTNSNPNTWNNWVPAPYTNAVGNNDEFSANIGTQLPAAGTYYYASRFQLNTGSYYYGGYSESGGGIWDGSNNISGVVTVDAPIVKFPVLFTIIDGTLLNIDIKFKGSMTAWDTVSMAANSHTWTLAMDLEPGTYEWGAIEDDGTASGLWLISGPNNLSVTIDNSGNITGTNTYTTSITTGINEPETRINVYPNPTQGILNLQLTQQASLLIYDLSGRKLLEIETASGDQQIDLSGFRSGSYLLEIRTGNSVQRKVIVKK